MASSSSKAGPRTSPKGKRPTAATYSGARAKGGPAAVAVKQPWATASMTTTEKIVWFCLLGLVFFTPLAMSNFTWLGSSAPLPLTYDQFDITKVFTMRAFALVGMAVWAFQFFLKGGKLRRTKIDWLILGFLAWVLITSFTSISPATALFGKYRRFEGFFSFLTYAVTYFLTIQLVDRPSRIRSLARVFMFSSLIVATYGVMQFLGIDPINWGANLPFEANRGFSTFGNPDLLGGFLVFPLVIGLAMVLSEKRVGWRIFYWTTFLITGLAWFTAYVRGAWIGGALGLIILVVAAVIAKAEWKVTDWSFSGITAAVGVGLVIKSLANPNPVLNIWERLLSIFKFGEGSALTRFEIWQAAIDATKARPIFGFGADTFRLVFPKYKPLAYVKDAGYLSVADNVHNYPLQLMAGIGVIGFLLLYGLFGWAFWLSAPNAFARGKGTERLVVAGFWAAAVGYLMHLMTGLSVTGSSVFLWIALAIIMSPSAREVEHEAPAWGAIVGTVLVGVMCVAFVGNIIFISADNFFLRGQFPMQGENAIELTKTAISLNPYNDIYRSMLGKAYEGQIGGWMKQASTDQAAGKDYTESLNQAKAAFRLAETTYKDTIAIVPTEYDNYLFLAALYNQAGQYFDPANLDLAIETANKGIEVEPFAPAIRLQKAVAQAAKGDNAGALVTVKSAVNMDPLYTDPHVFYAQLATRMGLYAEAADQYRQLLKLQPDNTGWSDALKAVEASASAPTSGAVKP